MLLTKWDDLPLNMKNESVKRYYDLLRHKQISLYLKRIFDLVIASLALIMLLPLFLIISIAIKIDSKGPVFFRQVRVTQNGKQFRIFKFRTMINNADKIGAQLTIKDDVRVTRVGHILRRVRLDEIPQLLNIIYGDMTFVGTRPEVVKYVERYAEEMMATLLLPAGVTSEASIGFRAEEMFLASAENADEIYINKILPAKMRYNLRSLEEFSFWGDIQIMLKTLVAVVKKERNSLTFEAAKEEKVGADI